MSDSKILRDHRGEVAGREIERPILFEDEPEGEIDYAHVSPEIAAAFSKFKASKLYHDPPASVVSFVAGWNAAKGERRAAELLGEAIEVIDAGISIDSSFAWVERARPFARFRDTPRPAIELPTDDPPEWVAEPAEDEPIPDVAPSAEAVEEAPGVEEFNELEQAERDEEARIEEEENAHFWRFGGYA